MISHFEKCLSYALAAVLVSAFFGFEVWLIVTNHAVSTNGVM